MLFVVVPFLAFAEGRADFSSAQWIGATAVATDSLADRSIILSKTMTCPEVFDRAEVSICGLGCYELYIDGRKVGNDILSPAWSDYKKTVWYNNRDISRYLTKGRHRIEVMLGNGFYHERGVRYHKLTTNYGPLTLLFCLRFYHHDRMVQTVVSDTSWLWRKSPVTYNSIYGGEDYDARLERQVSPDDDHAVVQKAPVGILRLQHAAPVSIMERYPVVQRRANNVFDMGQNLAGFPEIAVRRHRGQTIQITVGERLRPDGRVSQKQTGKPYFYRYTLKGNGIERWHPRFSYYSFRYIQIEAVDGQELPEIIELKSDFIYNSAGRTATFSCSNPLLNDTYRIIDNAVKSNWMSVWTDCPSREKLGWLEQDWLNGEGLLTNYDCRQMVRQEMQVIADAQHANGSMPEIAPEYAHFEGSWAKPFLESPEWGGALVALPFLYAQCYGDSSLIRQYMPNMRRYVDYLATRDSAYILNMGLGDWYDYGPWRAGFSRNTPVDLVSTAHYYRWTKMVGYEDRADSIKQAFIARFSPFCGNSHCRSSQAGLSIMLYLGLYHEGQREALADSLVALIHRQGDRLTTGDIGTHYLFRALINMGQEDLLYKILNHYEVPGYGAQIKKGMTTLTEQWDPDKGASLNHFMLAHINNHLVPDIGGLHIRGNRVSVSPLPMGSLSWAKASVVVDGKRVATSWQICNGVFYLQVEAPDKHIITVEYDKIQRMCAKRHLRLQYQFVHVK